jgi:uncharacterized membrane protein YcjF (UPF0283 family)
MTVDWVTWSIWLVGFLIMVIWILVPIREFRRLLAKRKTQEESEKASPGKPTSGSTPA